MNTEPKMKYAFQPHNTFLNKFRDVLRWLFFGIIVWLLVIVLGFVISLAFVALMFWLSALSGNSRIMQLLAVLSVLLPLTFLIVLYKVPGMIFKGSYLVFLNNNIRAKQMPYNLKSFFIITSLESEAQKVMGSNRR